MPLERARTLLALGSAQRRAGRGAQPGSLGQALAIFEQLGAAIWIQRTRTESRGSAAAPPGGDIADPGRARVAELVADGFTNKEGCRARRHRAHHRVDPDQGVREARCALAHRACAPPQRGASRSFVDRRAHTTRGCTRQRAWVSTFRTVLARPNLEIDHRCHRHSYIPPSASSSVLASAVVCLTLTAPAQAQSHSRLNQWASIFAMRQVTVQCSDQKIGATTRSRTGVGRTQSARR